jgi:hypothetical protein
MPLNRLRDKGNEGIIPRRVQTRSRLPLGRCYTDNTFAHVILQ